MAALPRTDAAMRRALVSLACAGALTVSAVQVADEAGLKLRTVQRYGRESLPANIDDHWRASYRHGRFTIVEIQTGVVML